MKIRYKISIFTMIFVSSVIALIWISSTIIKSLIDVFGDNIDSFLFFGSVILISGIFGLLIGIIEEDGG